MNHLLHGESYDDHIRRMEEHSEREHCVFCVGLFHKNELKNGRCDQCTTGANNLTQVLKGSPSDTCFSCKEEFSEKNVFTDAGWLETKLSGLCERCFNKIFEGED